MLWGLIPPKCPKVIRNFAEGRGMPRRNRSPQRQRRLPPAAPVSPPPPAPDDLHFRTGIMGWLARIFARMRAAGDPYDQTLVLPALITIIIMNLNHVKGFPDWTVAAASSLIERLEDARSRNASRRDASAHRESTDRPQRSWVFPPSHLYSNLALVFLTRLGGVVM